MSEEPNSVVLMEDTQHPTLTALDTVDELLSSIDTDGFSSCPETDLVAVMRRARKLADRMQALASVATDQVNRRQASMKAVGTPTTSLIAIDGNLDSSQAAGEVKLAGFMSTHEAPMKAALGGEITTRQAAAIAKGIASLPELPDDVTEKVAEAFVTTARGVSARKLAALAPKVLEEVAPELALSNETLEERAARQRAKAVERRSFIWGHDGEGSVWFKGLLPETEAEPIVRTLTAMVAANKREQRDREQSLRDSGIDPWTRQDLLKAEKNRTPVQRSADAFLALFHQAINVTGRSRRGSAAQIRVTIALSDLLERSGAGGILDSGTELTAGELRRLAAEAEIIPFVLGGESQILDQGRARRLVTPQQRQALDLRDGGCIFPACAKPPEECEAHHIDPWAQLGQSNLEDLALFCKHHHNIVEPDRIGRRDQWRVEFHPAAGRPEVIPPRRLTAS